MKNLLCILLVMVLVSCNKDVESKDTIEYLQQEWQYISFTGSEGPQCFYERGLKIYVFEPDYLIVFDNYFDDDICALTFLGEGQYSYEVKVIDETEYLFIDDQEQGRIRFVDGELWIESWFNSTGVIIEDSPTYKLEL